MAALSNVVVVVVVALLAFRASNLARIEACNAMARDLGSSFDVDDGGGGESARRD
jgi:hypothetical protein